MCVSQTTYTNERDDPLNTQCNTQRLDFHPAGKRDVVACFDGGLITSDGGVLLLRQVIQKTGIIDEFAECFTDSRDPRRVKHTLTELLAQRVIALALGYEDLNDHDELRYDPALALAVGKTSIMSSRRGDDKPVAQLAGKSTLNRLELGTLTAAPTQKRYKKITLDPEKAQDFFVKTFLDAFDAPPDEIVLDFDATDDPLHGKQEGRFFHGYYKQYCYLPLYVFCGEHLLCAKLRPADIDGAFGTEQELERIAGLIRQRWPHVRIILRGDSGFCRDSIMASCETNRVDYVLGLAKNARLKSIIEDELAQAKAAHAASGHAARLFASFDYRTLDSWSRSRRVIAKAEHLDKGSNPRFIVTTLDGDARHLYEDIYCARGEMENRIKEQQLYLFADRTSTHWMGSNQIRLWFSSLAYTLLQTLRRVGLKGTEMAKAQCHTIRRKLLKIGAIVRITVRKVWVRLSESYPFARLFERVHANLSAWRPQRC